MEINVEELYGGEQVEEGSVEEVPCKRVDKDRELLERVGNKAFKTFYNNPTVEVLLGDKTKLYMSTIKEDDTDLLTYRSATHDVVCAILGVRRMRLNREEMKIERVVEAAAGCVIRPGGSEELMKIVYLEPLVFSTCDAEIYREHGVPNPVAEALAKACSELRKTGSLVVSD